MRVLFLDIDWRFFDREFMGERVSSFLWFGAIVVLTLLLKKPVAALIARIGSRLAARFSYIQHKRKIAELLFKPLELLLQVVLFFFATQQLSGLLEKVSFHVSIVSHKRISISLEDVIEHIFQFLFIVFLTRVLARFVDFISYLRMARARLEHNHARIQLLPLVQEMGNMVLWILSVFWILGSVFNVNVPALITGLGIGGVAIALAGKETVENFFAAFTILSDKPFQTGDMIRIDNVEAVVERIGFRSTLLRNPDGSAYIVPNQKLVSQNLVNLSSRDRHGLSVAVHVRYGISHPELDKMAGAIVAAVKKIPLVKEPVTVSVDSFEKETFKLVVSYDLPHPLPGEADLDRIKNAVNMTVFEIVSSSAQLGGGTPAGG